MQYAGPTLIVTMPRNRLPALAVRRDVSSIMPAPTHPATGALANETAAVGAPMWWGHNHVGGRGNADSVAANLAVMDDKIEEGQPLFEGLTFERPQGASTSTKCGQSSAGCEHGTEVAGMAVAAGNSSCPILCSIATAPEKGIAYGVAHVLDADFTTTPDSDVCLFDSGIWALGVSESPIGECSHQMPGAAQPAAVRSDSHGSPTVDDDSIYEQNIDKLTSTFGVIETEPSGNDGAKGSGAGYITDSCIAYDAICVGGVSVNDPATTDDDAVADFSSEGPSPSGRKKPDIVAIAAGGDNGNMTVLEQRYIANNRLERGDTGTSFASPQVAGAAALLYGAGLTDPLVVKAILLDSTTLGRLTPASSMGTQNTWQPDWGWGELNLDAAYQERDNFAADSVGAQGVRLYRASVSAGDRATLVWNRRVVGDADQTAVPQPLTLSNLDLFEYDGSQNQQASSTSSIDNVEQVQGAAPGSVVYKIKNESSTVDGLAGEPFALAAKNPLTQLTAPKPTVALALDRASARSDGDVVVTETIHNPSGDLPGSNTTASLSLPGGVSVTSGGATTWSPGGGTLAANTSVSHQWTVQGAADGVYDLAAAAQDTAYDETFAGSGQVSLHVDSTPPAPSISCPASGGTNPRLGLAWNATDSSAIGSYDVDISTDGGPYSPWLAGTAQTSAVLSGRPGASYGLRVRARDTLGNLSGYAFCGPIAIGFIAVPPSSPLPAPIKLLPAAPHLKVAKLHVRRGRLAVEGTLASSATGWVSCVYRGHGRRTVRARTKVVHGRYRVSLRLPNRHSRGIVQVQYSGDRSFAPQRLSRRVK